MAFRKKYEQILELNPDLLVLQECEHENKLKETLRDSSINQILWHGTNQHKGVCVITFNNTTVHRQDDHNIEYEHVLPLTLEAESGNINLFCVWAMPHKTDRTKSYVGQVWGALNYYSKLLDNKSILIGDFNSNSIWDRKNRVGNHTDVVNILKNKNIFSLYHAKNELMHGAEKHPTLYLTKNSEKPYHLDYCFASAELYNSETNITVGAYDNWIGLSDHMPLIIDNMAIKQ